MRSRTYASDSSQHRMKRIDDYLKTGAFTNKEITSALKMPSSMLRDILTFMTASGYLERVGDLQPYRWQSTHRFVMKLNPGRARKPLTHDIAKPNRSAPYIRPFQDSWLWALHKPYEVTA